MWVQGSKTEFQVWVQSLFCCLDPAIDMGMTQQTIINLLRKQWDLSLIVENDNVMFQCQKFGHICQSAKEVNIHWNQVTVGNGHVVINKNKKTNKQAALPYIRKKKYQRSPDDSPLETKWNCWACRTADDLFPSFPYSSSLLKTPQVEMPRIFFSALNMKARVEKIFGLSPNCLACVKGNMNLYCWCFSNQETLCLLYAFWYPIT